MPVKEIKDKREKPGDKKRAETLTMAGILISDKEDLIRKAVGWMLREVGKRAL